MTDDARDRGGDAPSPWPRDLRGVTETVVATRGPNDRWNHAALGVHAPATTDFPHPGRDEGATGPDVAPGTDHDVAAAAFTYGRTRTWRNFHERGRGVVQFTTDAVDFATAALAVHETDEPVLDSADAWVEIAVTQVDARDEDGTRIERWRLDPVDATVRTEVVPVVNRGHAAVVDATVAASRLGVPGYDDDYLRDRLDHAVDVVDACGGPREFDAIHLVADRTDDWTPRGELPDRTGT